MKVSRVFAMPKADTLQCKPIGDLVRRYLTGVSVDPFARNCTLATYTNDANPETQARYHMDAEAFLYHLRDQRVAADVVIFDPPYSPRQIAEHYKSLGQKPSREDTQNARLNKRVRSAIRSICRHGSIVISCGWNTVGMGRDWQQLELLVVYHGGGHNDTLVLVERFHDEDLRELAGLES